MTAVLIAGTAIVQGAVLVGFAARIVSNLESERVDQQLDMAAGEFTARVAEFRRLPLTLADTPPVERIAVLNTGGAPRTGESLSDLHRRMGAIFRSMFRSNPSLLQARLVGIANGGRDLVRVRRIGGSVEIAAGKALQQNARLAYYRRTIGLRIGEVYLSPIELAAGAWPSGPLRPVMHAATPVYTPSGQLFGIVAVNAAADHWLRRSPAFAGPGRYWAVNQDGAFIYRSDGHPVMAPLTELRLLNEWPKPGAVFDGANRASLHVYEGDHLLSARRVQYDPGDPSKFLVVASDTDASPTFGDTWLLIIVGTLVAIAMAVIGVLAARLVSRPLRSLMNAARRIAAGKLDVAALAEQERGADVGELGEALHIMKDAIESRETSLQKSEVQLEAIVENAIDGLITVDRSEIIQRYNRGCEKIFGYAKSEAIGRHVSLLIDLQEGDPRNFSLGQLAQAGAPYSLGERREIVGRHKSGRPVDIEVALARINAGGEQLLSAVIRDITERKRVERMKSEFVSTVTHELRTPLTSIMASLKLARAGKLGPLSGKLDRMLNIAYDNSTRLSKLIGDILEIDQIEAGGLKLNTRSETLITLVATAVEQNAAFADQHAASIVVEEIAHDIVVDADPERFLQVMASLITNAAKFSPQGGKIVITAGMTDRFAQVSVADQGSGIPDAFREHIFEKFAQADSSDTRAIGGTGLGLWIAKALVEQMGGRIGFESQLGVGTTFFVDVPAHIGASGVDRGGDDGPDVAAGAHIA